MGPSERGRLEAELAACERELMRLAGEDPDGSPVLAGALYAKGQLFWELERRDQALEVFDALIELCSGTVDRSVQQYVGVALAFKAERVYRRRGYAEAVAICDEVLARERDGRAVWTISVSMAMGWKALALGKLDRGRMRLLSMTICSCGWPRRIGSRSTPSSL